MSGDGRREAILVLGMHRSGTSALTGMLAKLGARKPRTLLPAAEDNPEGFWESEALMHFHDALLASAGGEWRDWEPFNPDWAGSAVSGQFAEQLPSLLEREFGDARLLLVKDPRICRFVPFWLSTLRDLAIDPKVIIPVRDPVEVADSLARRNGFSQVRSLLSWLRHVLDAEHATRGGVRVVTFYEDLLRDWRSVAKRIGDGLDVKWPRWSSAVEAEIDTFLQPALRHHRAGQAWVIENPHLEHWIGTTWGALRAIADGGPGVAEAQRDLDAVRADLDRLASVFGWRLQELEQKLASQTIALEAQERAAEDMARQLGELRDNREQTRAALAAGQAQITQLLDAQARQADDNAVLESDNRALEQQLQLAGKERAEVAGCLAITEKKLRMCREELAALREAQESQQEAAARLPAAVRERDALAARLAAQLSKEHWREVEAGASRPRWRRAARRLLRRGDGNEEPAQLRLLEGSDLFDGGYYLREYPDVLQAGMSPAVHYLRHGWAEGRNPGPGFDGGWYLQRHADVAVSRVNPLLHYLMFGKAEGRPIRAVRSDVPVACEAG